MPGIPSRGWCRATRKRSPRGPHPPTFLVEDAVELMAAHYRARPSALPKGRGLRRLRITALMDRVEASAGELRGGARKWALPERPIPAFEDFGSGAAPLDSEEALRRESRELHNCAVRYLREVQRGTSYLYSVHVDGQRLTARFERTEDAWRLCELRGRENRRPTIDERLAVLAWVDGSAGTPGPST